MICVNAEEVTRVLGDEPWFAILVGQSAQCRALELESLDFIAHRLFLCLLTLCAPS